MIDVWKDIPNYIGLYKINNKGVVKSLSHVNNRGVLRPECILSDRITDRGYNTAVLYKNGVSKTFKIHRLVAICFIKNPLNKPHVNHINGIKLDNNVENLEWCTISENISHAFKLGLNKITCERNEKGMFVKKIKNENY